jgi:hypothetical protein
MKNIVNLFLFYIIWFYFYRNHAINFKTYLFMNRITHKRSKRMMNWLALWIFMAHKFYWRIMIYKLWICKEISQMYCVSNVKIK